MSSTVTLAPPTCLERRSSRSRMLKAVSAGFGAAGGRSIACTRALFQSATNSTFAGPAARRDIDLMSAASSVPVLPGCEVLSTLMFVSFRPFLRRVSVGRGTQALGDLPIPTLRRAWEHDEAEWAQLGGTIVGVPLLGLRFWLAPSNRLFARLIAAA